MVKRKSTRAIYVLLAGLVALVAMQFIGQASAQASVRSGYCPGNTLCGSTTVSWINNYQLSGGVSITDVNPLCGISYSPREEGWARVWWNDGYSNYYGKVEGTCNIYNSTTFTTPRRTGQYPTYVMFLACPNRVVNGNYGNCHLGQKLAV